MQPELNSKIVKTMIWAFLEQSKVVKCKLDLRFELGDIFGLLYFELEKVLFSCISLNSQFTNLSKIWLRSFPDNLSSHDFHLMKVRIEGYDYHDLIWKKKGKQCGLKGILIKGWYILSFSCGFFINHCNFLILLKSHL